MTPHVHGAVTTATAATPSRAFWDDAGVLGCLMIGVVLLALALTVDFPKAAFAFQSDEATYYSLGHSLAADFDFAFERRDLERVWREFPTGPEGIFLKKGKDISVSVSGRPPFLEWRKGPDSREDRLYYGKSFVYPLAAAPFVRLAGTNGFLALHAVLLGLDLLAAYAFLRARSPAPVSFAYAITFIFASATPVYFVWLTPEIFNFSLVLLGLFAWAYKEVAQPPTTRLGVWLRQPSSDVLAMVLIGIATFSKPTNAIAIVPILALAAWRSEWRRGLMVGSVMVATTLALFAANAATSGEFNYQGGERNTFYGGSGFPFMGTGATFETVGQSRATNEVPTDVLLNRDALTVVFPHNLVYFTIGRHTGLVPYFFPGVFSALLLAVWTGGGARKRFQLVVALAAVLGALALMLYMPFTYSGGGGPIGNRYFLGFYGLFLFLTPPLASMWGAVVPAAIGALFTAQLVLNPFFTSYRPAEHTKRGLFRLLPVELSLLNDLPMNVTPARVKQPLGGEPRVQAYFLDDYTYNREGEWFWVRGGSRAELVLRAPVVRDADGTDRPLHIKRLLVEARAGDVGTRVTIRTGAGDSSRELGPQESAVIPVRMPNGFPYKPVPGLPTNFLYLVSVSSTEGFIPLFSSGGRDTRQLGAMLHVVPVYE